MAQLYKARRDEVFAGNHPALCADHRRHQPDGANGGVFLSAMPMIFDRDGNELADIPLSEKQSARARSRRGNRDHLPHAADAAVCAGREIGIIHAAQDRRRISSPPMSSACAPMPICSARSKLRGSKPDASAKAAGGIRRVAARCGAARYASLRARWRTSLPA